MSIIVIKKTITKSNTIIKATEMYGNKENN